MRFTDFSVLDKIPGVPVQLFSEDMLPICRSSFSISYQIENNFEEGKIKKYRYHHKMLLHINPFHSKSGKILNASLF